MFESGDEGVAGRGLEGVLEFEDGGVVGGDGVVI